MLFRSSSFLSYAGLQEEQDRAGAGAGGDDETTAIALEKIAKASRPIDVASKPAIAAHILEERKTEKQLAAISEPVVASSAKATTMKIKPKPKKTAATTAKASAAAAAAAEAPEIVVEEAASAPIEQIEKKIQKRTKKVKASASEEGAGAAAAPSVDAAPAPKAKRQTKKKSDL